MAKVSQWQEGMSRILRDKYKTMLEKITKINDELEGSPFQKQQQFILFSLSEAEALRNAMEAAGFSKSRTISIGCRLLLEEVEKTKSEKKDDGAK